MDATTLWHTGFWRAGLLIKGQWTKLPDGRCHTCTRSNWLACIFIKRQGALEMQPRRRQKCGVTGSNREQGQQRAVGEIQETREDGRQKAWQTEDEGSKMTRTSSHRSGVTQVFSRHVPKTVQWLGSCWWYCYGQDCTNKDQDIKTSIEIETRNDQYFFKNVGLLLMQ